jgi:phosphomethylpyrimidine synthase
MNRAMPTSFTLTDDDLRKVAESEAVDYETILQGVTSGSITVVKNRLRSTAPMGVGTGLRTKVNANIGTSPDLFDLDTELEKLKAAADAGADAVMDLSTGGDLSYFRQAILEESSIPLGTVPLYEVTVNMTKKKLSILDMTIDDILPVIEKQAKEGVDFMTIHSGVTLSSMASLNSMKRIIGVTSRGGSILAEWMSRHKKENPLYEHYDEVLDILAEYNVVISLGDGLRPGALADAQDRGQIHEMIVLGELTDRAREKGVQVIIEGPGHMPLDQIVENMKLEKKLCSNAPYYVLGPLVTDVAPGYDHITSAIGGALAASHGADFLCYVTPAEHLRLPDAQDVKEGVIASRIAAHAADVVKLGQKARQWDDDMSRARKKRDWNTMFDLAIDPVKAKEYRDEVPSEEDDQCSMCGEYCAIKRDIEEAGK